MHPAIAEASACLRQAREHGRPCAPVRDLIERAAAEQDGPALMQAYAVQQYNNAADIAAGWNPVGHKIGLTSRVVQRQLGVDQPDFGRLFAQMARGDGQPISWSDCQQPKVEAEIALVLERDLCNERHTLADIIRATAFALPAIEIVGSRIANWDISLLDTVADNASSGLFVLGSQPVSLGQIDLVNCGMRLSLRGEPVSVGAGAACLENPLNAALWLANTMVRLGEPLRAGDVVLTGALGPMVPVSPGDVFIAEIQGLGRVTASFAQAE